MHTKIKKKFLFRHFSCYFDLICNYDLSFVCRILSHQTTDCLLLHSTVCILSVRQKNEEKGRLCVV